MQTPRQSCLEVIVGTGIGYSIALLSQAIIYPLFGISIGLSGNLVIALIFTVISLIRGYFVRRFFNWLWR